MTFGFEARRQDDTVFADSRHAGFGLIFQLSAWLPSAKMQDITVNFPHSISSKAKPIIAIPFYAWNYADYTVVVIGTPGMWTGCRVVVSDIRHLYILNVPSLPARTINLRVYASGLHSNETYGMRIYNSSNDLTLDTGWPQLEFSQYLRGGAWSRIESGQAVSGSSVYTSYVNFNEPIPPNSWIAITLHELDSFSVLANGVITKRTVLGLSNVLSNYNGYPIVTLVTGKLWANEINVPNLTFGAIVPIVPDLLN